MENLFAVLIFILIVGAALIISFFATCLILWLICWAFGLAFSWKIAFGVWLVLCLLRSIFKVTVNNSK